MEMPQPGPEHARLARFAGKWSGEEKMHPSPWEPQGCTAAASMQSRVACDGFWVVGDYEQRRDGVVCFRGHSVLGYDQQAGEVTLHWFDSMGIGAEVFRGKFLGDALVVTCKNPMGFHRLTYDLRDANTLCARMETAQDAKTWSPMFDGVYQRES